MPYGTHTPTQKRWSSAPARRWSALLAAGTVVAFALVYGIFVARPSGQGIDQIALQGAQVITNPMWDRVATVLDVISEGFIIAAVVTAAAIAIIRRRWLLAVQAVIVIVGANITTQLLKATLPRGDFGIGRDANTLPSGHTTAAASISIALMFVVPRRWRPLVGVIGAGYTTLTAVSVLVRQWHRPSDAIAALLVVAFWALAVSAVSLRNLRKLTSLPDDDSAPTSIHAHGVDRITANIGVAVLLIPGIVTGVITAIIAFQNHTETVLYRSGIATHISEVAQEHAFVGGVLAAVSASCVVFGLLLWIRSVMSRPARVSPQNLS